ncbi:MAG: hypothetical protein AAGB32_01940 [Pseudomonadota bacterium]
MSVHPNVLLFQERVSQSEGLCVGLRLRGLWSLNVKFHLRNSDMLKKGLIEEHEIYLANIKATVPKTRLIGGGKALDWLHSVADELGVPIALFASPISNKGLNAEQLTKMYRRRGYERVNERGLMKRQPVV